MSSDLIMATPSPAVQSPCDCSPFRTLPNRYQPVKAQSAKRLLRVEEAAEPAGTDRPRRRPGQHPYDAPVALPPRLPVDDAEVLWHAALLFEVFDRLGLAADAVD